MATTLQTLIDTARLRLLETAASFWSDAELLTILVDGVKDLWRAINDNYQDYFLTVDVTNVSLAAGAYTLTGVPVDVSIVRGIEPRDLAASPYAKFEFRPWGHRDFVVARQQGSLTSDQVRLFYYCITGAGAPTGAPTIRVAPAITTALNLSLNYVPVLGTLTVLSNNPIPGESDAALVTWLLAHAQPKEAENRSPDLILMAEYKDQRQGILTSLTPRQTQDEEVVEALFQDYW